LSIPLLETLAIIAYRQPATTAEITAIRGKDPGAAVRRLRELSLVRVTGRRRTVGRPFTYGTTDAFLELFGLRGLDELPAPEEFHELLES
jgi:segregation and condensation protein B